MTHAPTSAVHVQHGWSRPAGVRTVDVHLQRTRALELTRKLLRCLQVNVGNKYVGAGAREFAAGRRTNPACAASHQRNLRIQPKRLVQLARHLYESLHRYRLTCSRALRNLTLPDRNMEFHL